MMRALSTQVSENKGFVDGSGILARKMLCNRGTRGESTMSAATSPNIHLQDIAAEAQMTLLELVQAVCEVTSDDREVVATVRHMLRNGRVRLTGNFRDREFKLL